jgi:hypothetical protein
MGLKPFFFKQIFRVFSRETRVDFHGVMMLN